MKMIGARKLPEWKGYEKQCGIDEAGRGPVIGPMFMSLVCGDTADFNLIGVRDSKTLSPNSRERIYRKIMEGNFLVRYLEITPDDLNSLMESMNLNDIEFRYAVKLLEYAEHPVVVDCFDTDEARGSDALSRYSRTEVICLHGADATVPAVSAASIVSKVNRDRRIKELHKIYGDFGSGYPSDPRTIAFLRNALENGMKIDHIVRKRWKTYTRMLADKLSKRIEDF